MAGDRLFRLIAAGLFASVLLSACGGGGGGGGGGGSGGGNGGGDVGDGRVAVVEDKTPPISPPTGGVAVVEDKPPPMEDKTPQNPPPSSVGSDDKDNKPPPPEIMKADSDSPLSPQEPVLAATESGAAESGAALLTVTVSNGGELLPFTDANGFASEGGSVAVISLSRAAAALFTADGLVMSLVLTATNAGGTVLSTVSFASSALGIDGAGLTLHLTTALLRSETELFAATDASLTIWHNGDKEEKYELSGLGWDLFTVGADGGVRVADDLPVSGEGAFYGLTLRLTDGAVDAERSLSLRLTPPQTEITPPRTEAPPLPEIEGELLGETKLVNALSGSGTALLAVTVSNGGALSPIADANGFASDGGAVAVISLARSATALFTRDNLTLSLALTATNAGGTVSATVSFASSARGFDGLGLSLHLTTTLLRPETELFAAADSRLTIWHNDGKEENYELSGLDSQLFAADADGGVRVAADLPVSGEGAFYELTLRLTDGAAIAERLLFLRLTPPLPEIEGELLGETKLVNALSGSGTALLAVTVSNGGALLSFADANGFASDGGAVAVISLSRSAAALFTLDGLTLSLALTATNAGGTVSATVSFASSARGFNGMGLTLHLTTALLRSGTELFAAVDSRLTIWHNDGKEESYELSGLDSQLFAAGADGGVRVASDLPVSGEGAFYELTLRLTDGAEIAERLLFLRLTPPLPEIEGELSGETKLVNALSGSGTALLAVTVSNGGALSPIADANGFASGGGAVAVISLARSATALFTRDGLTLSLALTATNAGGTVSETVSFASSARGFDGLGLSLHLTTALLRPETELFAATDASLTIWHNDGKKESYELSGLDSELFAAGADGGVRVASDLPVSGEGAFYELTLRLTDGAANAERLLFLRLTPPLPEIEGELLGEVKLVNALSGSGTALLAVTVSSGGALLSFTDANGFASDGGAVAVISLARSAAALFTRDNLTLSLALTATSAGGTVSATVSFASSARGFDGLGLSLHLTTALLRPETELFAATDANLTIWHSGGKEESYELSGLDSELFAAGADGGVRVAGDLPVSGEGAFYELTLRLTDGAAIAERLLFLRLTPPLPEIEGVSGEVKLVDALSGSGTALLAVTVSNGGALSPIADANGFASGGGAVAVISLARSATALFTLDGLTLSLALTATNAGGTVSATVSFASSARGFDGLGLSLHLTTALLRSETELFAATDASLTIWHNDGKEENYKLSGLDSQLFVADADGGVRVASDLPVSGEGAFYELTLRLTDGAAIAERLLFLRLTPPLPEIEGELSSETKLVNALSGSGTALLAVTVSNGGALSPFSDANGFASDGGAVAVISLARSAAALFTLDGLTLSLTLTATNAGGTVSEVVSFASSARGFDGLELSLHLTTALLRPETELFAARDAGMTIWHNDGKEESYELSGLDSQLFAADADGEVRVASDLPVLGEGALYELTLRLTDGAANAERLLFLRLMPPLPEIEGELLGETKLVNALSGSGTALLTVTVSNGGALSPFADANGFASDGGAVAVISLARSATALFTLDGLTLSLALTATNAGGTVSATVSFVSSALGIDGAGLFASFATVMLPSETEVFAAADARLTIWHNGDKQETYELSGADASLFAVDANGGVRTASDLSSSEDDLLYELTLRLTDGAAIAERLLTLALLPPPIAVDMEVECAGQWPCRDQFAAALSAAIESGEATLDHERAIVLDASPGHGDIVASAFRTYGSGASVRLTVINRGRGGPSAVTSVVFAKLPAKKKLIVAHSVGDFIASAETMKEKEAVVAQSAGNIGLDDPTYYYNSSGFYPDDVVQGSIRAEKILELGLMAVVGGIAKVSEVPAAGVAHSAYCATGKPHITLEGVDYCSVYNRCGWTANYCLVAPAENVIYDAETGARDGGTSLAGPQAAAALQMLATMWPDLSQTDLVALLLELADDIGEPGIDPVYGHGRLSFRRLYEPGGLSPFIVGGEAFRFSCDADSNTCQKSPIENVDSENEENKQPPEIIKADSDSPLSSQEPVLAAAESGTALLTVTVSNGGALSPFTDTNGFASDGGAVAVISLARSAAALFTLDGLTLSLALTATNAGGTVSATVSFVSSALGIDGAGLFASFATVILPSETEVFAAADARLTIWHNDNAQETYELSGTDASLFAVDVNGGVRTASDLSSSEDDLLYELTLRLTDGAAIAERLLTLALLPPPIAVDVEVECAGQWPCRDQFAAALSAAIESGEATLDHGQAVVIDLDREGNTHGSRVRSAFQLYGSGASVSLTLAEVERTGPNREILHTPDAFLELPAKKKQIVAHSIADLIAPAETLEEKDAIVAQSAANNYRPFPSFYRRDGPALITAAVETGLMVVVGGIAKTSERYSLVEGYGYPEIDLNDRRTYFDYCDGTTNQSGRAGPPNVITLNGEGYCSVYDRCGWMQNYCLVAPAENILTDVETGQRSRGTSFAAPQAAAALQMLGTMWPELSSRELALMLLELADDVGEAGIDDVYGHGALSFRRLYAPDGLSPFIVGDEIFRFSCDADANTCQKERLERP